MFPIIKYVPKRNTNTRTYKVYWIEIVSEMLSPIQIQQIGICHFSVVENSVKFSVPYGTIFKILKHARISTLQYISTVPQR